jgi:hypothetical protein
VYVSTGHGVQVAAPAAENFPAPHGATLLSNPVALTVAVTLPK